MVVALVGGIRTMALDEYVFSISDITIKKTIVRGRTMVFYVALAIANNENVKK